MDSRRRLPRQQAGWTGVCLIENELSTVGWRECHVLDISVLGIGVTLVDHRVDALVGQNIAVEFPAASDAVSVRLGGVIKNARRIEHPLELLVRVGIEFGGNLSVTELAITTVLGALTEVDGPEHLQPLRL
jgi:hypothetical protein